MYLFFIFIHRKQCSTASQKLTFWCTEQVIFIFLFFCLLCNAISKTIEALDFLCLCFLSSGSMTLSHTNACVFCVRSRNPPSSFITDPKWICCSWTKTLGCFGPVAEDCATCYICRDHQRPHQTNARQHRHTSQQTTKPAQPLRHRRLNGNNRFSLSVCPLYVLYMWKIERKHIFILLYRWEKWNQDPIGALFTLLKQNKKKTKKKVIRKGLTFFVPLDFVPTSIMGKKMVLGVCPPPWKCQLLHC